MTLGHSANAAPAVPAASLQSIPDGMDWLHAVARGAIWIRWSFAGAALVQVAMLGVGLGAAGLKSRGAAEGLIRAADLIMWGLLIALVPLAFMLMWGLWLVSVPSPHRMEHKPTGAFVERAISLMLVPLLLLWLHSTYIQSSISWTDHVFAYLGFAVAWAHSLVVIRIIGRVSAARTGSARCWRAALMQTIGLIAPIPLVIIDLRHPDSHSMLRLILFGWLALMLGLVTSQTRATGRQVRRAWR